MIRKMMLTLTILVMSPLVIAQQAQDKPSAEPKQKTINPVVKMVTTRGDILIELYADKAPITVENFLKYTKEGLYNGTIFHRVISGFMIQGGGITTDMVNKLTKSSIKNESYNKLRNKRGTLAMARMNAPDSATNQFFINHVDNKALDFDGPYKPGYAVFGKVIKGMDVVDQIASVKTKNSQYYDEKYKRQVPCQNVPVEPVVIESVILIDDKACDAQEKSCCAKEKKECKKQDKENKSTEKTE